MAEFNLGLIWASLIDTTSLSPSPEADWKGTTNYYPHPGPARPGPASLASLAASQPGPAHFLMPEDGPEVYYQLLPTARTEGPA